VDGHSDFTHPGSYDTSKLLGAAAGMDLALASGRGEALLTDWPEVGAPLANDADIVQVGERNAGSPAFMQYYGDILNTEITQITVQNALAAGIDAAAHQTLARLEARGLEKAWLHVDLDVLDEAVMPAVDSPGSPGFDYAQLARLVGALCASGRIAGANFSIYDPERDPGARHAPGLVGCIADGIRQRVS
jgi:arginase